MIALQRRQTAEAIALVEEAIAQNEKIAAAHNIPPQMTKTVVAP